MIIWVWNSFLRLEYKRDKSASIKYFSEEEVPGSKVSWTHICWENGTCSIDKLVQNGSSLEHPRHCNFWAILYLLNFKGCLCTAVMEALSHSYTWKRLVLDHLFTELIHCFNYWPTWTGRREFYAGNDDLRDWCQRKAHKIVPGLLAPLITA